MSYVKYQQLGEEGERFMAATTYIEENLSATDSNGNVNSNLYAKNGKLMSTMPLSLVDGAQIDINNGDDYYLTTKKYVDDNIADVQENAEELAKSLSIAQKRIEDLETIQQNFSVDISKDIKPAFNGIATIGSLSVQHSVQSSVESYVFQVDVSEYARLANPHFAGEPTAPDIGTKGSQSSQIVTENYIMKDILGVVEGASLSSLSFSGGYKNVNEIAKKVEANAASIADLSNNKQASHAALTSIANLNSKPSSTDRYKIIYSSKKNEYHNTEISNTMLELLQKKDEAAIAEALSVPRIKNNAISTTNKVTWGNLIAGTASIAYNDKNGKDITDIYATKEELASLSSACEDYLRIVDGITDITVTPKITQGTEIGSISYVKGFSSVSSVSLCVNLSNYAQLKTDKAQTFTKKFQIKDGNSKLSDVATIQDITDITSALTQSLTQSFAQSIATKQDASKTLSAIAKITGSIGKDKILYTSADNTFGLADISYYARGLLAKNETDIKAEFGVTENGTASSSNFAAFAASAATATFATSAATATTAASANSATTATSATSANYATYDDGEKNKTTKMKIIDKYVKKTDVYDTGAINGGTINNPSDLKWSSTTDYTSKPVGLNTLAFWDGRFNIAGVTLSGGTEKYSNLEYCKFGKFGDIVTHGFSDISSGLSSVSISDNKLTLTNSDGSTLQATLPSPPVSVSDVTVTDNNKIEITKSGSSIAASYLINPVYFSVCKTKAAIDPKIVSIPNLAQSGIPRGTSIVVQFSYKNTNDSPTLQVNNDTACPLVYRGSEIISTAIQKDMIIPLVKTTFTDNKTTKDCWAIIGSHVWIEE